MADADPKYNSSPLLRPAWTTLLAVGGALAAVGTVILHLIGVMLHSSYLAAWGVDTALFPKSTDFVLINGYYGVFERALWAIGLIGSNVLAYLGVVFLAGLYVHVLLMPLNGRGDKLMERLRDKPEWVRGLVRTSLLTALASALVPAALLGLILLLLLPAASGESAGRNIASREAVDFAKGCATSKRQCVELRREGATVIRGHLIDTSLTHIAIFDVDLKTARSLPRGELEVKASRMPH
jgi:hypothetical protein